MIIKKHYLECDCCHPEHALKLIHFPKYKDDVVELYLTYYLSRKPILGRIKSGFKYIFGLDDTNQFNEFLFNKESAELFKSVLEEYLQEIK